MQLANDNYTVESQNFIRQQGLSYVAKLIRHSAWTKVPELANVSYPNPTQVKWLEGLQAELSTLQSRSPCTVQEQTLLQGGELEYATMTNPHVEPSQSPGIIAHKATGQVEKWVVDVVPVEVPILSEKPGLGRICYFLTQITKVKEHVIRPLMEVMNLEKYEVYLFEPKGVSKICQFLQQLFKERRQELPKGCSGQAWLSIIYQLVSKLPAIEYLALHSWVISECLRYGTLNRDTWTFTLSAPAQKIVEVMVKRAISQNSVPKATRPFTPITREKYAEYVRIYPHFSQLAYVGYWTGDVFANRQAAQNPTTAVHVLQCAVSMSQNRGGAKGAMSLLTGKNSFGLPSHTLEKYEEMLRYLSALSRPYNVVGLSTTMIKVWYRARETYDESDLAHRFVVSANSQDIPNCVLRPDPDLPTIYFDYGSVENIFKWAPRVDSKTNNDNHYKEMIKWSSRFYTAADIWIGAAILPFVVSPDENLSHVKAYPGFVPFDGRAAFSMTQVSTGYVDGTVQRVVDNVQKTLKVIKVSTLKGYGPQEWGMLVHKSIMSVPGYLVHPPRFVNTSVSSLLPKFTDVQMSISMDDEWEMLSGVESYVKVAPVNHSAATFHVDASGSIVMGQNVPIFAPNVIPISSIPPHSSGVDVYRPPEKSNVAPALSSNLTSTTTSSTVVAITPAGTEVVTSDFSDFESFGSDVEPDQLS